VGHGGPGQHSRARAGGAVLGPRGDDGVLAGRAAAGACAGAALVPRGAAGARGHRAAPGLEIFALRQQAERALGGRFDLRAFHDVVLRNGAVALPMLRDAVEAWIAGQR
jgi:hypothetical protein